MNKIPSPKRIEQAMSAAMKLRDMLKSSDDVDHQLLADMIEGETDAMELLDRILETSIADKMLAEAAYARSKRLEERADRCRTLALSMLEEMGLTKVERAVYTASVADGPQSVVITSTAKIPADYWRQSPDKEAIKKALKDKPDAVPGAELSNPKPVLRVVTR